MSRKLKALYYDNKSGFQVLGCLMKKPTLIKDKKYQLNTKDFQEALHKYVFGAIYNLVMQGVEEITDIEIESYLSQTSPKHYKAVFEDNDGFDWISMAIESASLGNFEYNYDRLRKFTLLRRYIDSGMDVSEVLDQNEIDVSLIKEKNTLFNDMTTDDIKKYFKHKIMEAEVGFDIDDESSYRKAGDESYKIKERLKEDTPYGLLTQSGYYNGATRGMVRGKFAVRSGSSGIGKSRSALLEACVACAVELWDYEKEEFIINPNNPLGDLSCAYVGTELDLEDEVETILWAIISGVPTERILENTYLEGEEDRVDYAIEILGRSKIHLNDEPNYGIGVLDSICEERTLQDENFFGLFFDYISITGEIMAEFMATRKNMAIREDQVYLWISTECKKIAKKYDIYFGSSTQLNSKSTGDDEKNASMIRGSFALIDKVDLATIIALPTKLELERVDDIIKGMKGFNNPKPNRVEHIFKSRGTKYKEIRIFQWVDLGTMEITDLFVTDYEFKRLNIDPILPVPYEEDNE